MAEPVNICLIDADEGRRAQAAAPLQKAGYVLHETDNAAAALEIINEHSPDIIACGMGTPVPGDGPVAEYLCSQLADDDRYYLLLVHDHETAQMGRAREYGADDIVHVPCPEAELLSRVESAARTVSLTHDLQRVAITDRLTGLYNHAHFTALLDTEFARSRRYGTALSMLMIDLDYFKAINDTFGHQVGNEVLKITADILRRGVRDADVVARYGGEEFAIIAPEAPQDAAAEMAERLRASFAKDMKCPALRDQAVTASFGVASVDDARALTPADLIDLADRALYLAKHSGRDRVATSLEVADTGSGSGEENDEVFSLRKQVVELSIQARETFVQSIWALVQALEAKDPYTADHSRNVTLYAEEFARRLDLHPPLIRAIRHASMLHDLGTIGLPDAVMTKRGELTEGERQLLRRVPMITARILNHMRVLETELQIIRHQREYYDGSGHPAGLVGEQIPIGSRILLVADAFDSMTTDRAYRAHRSIEEALAEIDRNAGTQFDPRVVQGLREAAAEEASVWQARINAAHRHAQKSLYVEAGP